jgi:UDP-GlcNAc:undecaprenyl-phosphate/decaprenyl-phosphate GlcNAc-1-phosphate transferase
VFSYAFLGLTASVLALVVTPLVRALGLRFDVVDEPGGRRTHLGRVPRLGGLAVLAATLGAVGLAALAHIAVLETLAAQGWNLGWLAAGTFSVLAIGTIDDVRGLGPFFKIAFQVVTGVMALLGGYGFSAITNPLTGSPIYLGAFGGVATVLWVVGVTNAFNLIDGLDGLAAGVALIASATLFVVSLAEGRSDAAMLSITLAGALAGFLYYNFNPASVFLGDSGSLLLGYWLAILSIQSLHKGATTVVILVPILALGLPITDTLVTLLRRFLVSGISTIFHGDQEHIHYRLLTLGLTHRRAVLLLYAVCLAFGVLAFLAVAMRAAGDAVLVGVVAVAVSVAIRKLGYGRTDPGVSQSRLPRRPPRNEFPS